MKVCYCLVLLFHTHTTWKVDDLHETLFKHKIFLPNMSLDIIFTFIHTMRTSVVMVGMDMYLQIPKIIVTVATWHEWAVT